MTARNPRSLTDQPPEDVLNALNILNPIPLGLVSGSSTAAGMMIGAWRPPEWSQGTGATLTITAPVPTSGQTPSSGGFSSTISLGDLNVTNTIDAPQAVQQPTTVLYVFDGAIRADHQQEMVVTQNPVQTGAALTDHAYMLPTRLTVEIAMSDSMQSYVMGQFSGGGSRSVAAYQALLDLQASRQPLQVSTRLKQYSNMLITNLQPDESVNTRFGLKCQVTFQQIITAAVDTIFPGAGVIGAQVMLASALGFSAPIVSARPQTSGTSLVGSTQPQPVSDTIDAQHSTDNLPDSPAKDQASKVEAGGAWSSPNQGTTAAAINAAFAAALQP